MQLGVSGALLALAELAGPGHRPGQQGLLRRRCLYQQIVVIPDYFSWTLAYNTGAAFSFLADSSGWQRWLFALIAVVVSAVLVVWLKRLGRNETWLAVALALVLGGALGNLYDRIVLGHVVDFILVHWQNPITSRPSTWPTAPSPSVR
jgi:lipoprotein signal peptidase